jgi:hypothetical protein
MRIIARMLSIFALVAISACGAEDAQRAPKVQREVDACIAGMGGLVPDAKQRKIVCECTADATTKHQSDSDAMLKAVAKCRDKAGLDPNDPFDILDADSSNASQSEDSADYEEESSDYGGTEYASEDEDSSADE